jgi:hypothetical protein
MGAKPMLLSLAIVLAGFLAGTVVLALDHALPAILLGCLAAATAFVVWWLAAGAEP